MGWLWTHMALNTYPKVVALNAYLKVVTLTLMEIVALNAYANDGFECLWLWTHMASNAYLKVVALNTYERNDSKCLWKDGFERLSKKVALNAYGCERLWRNGFKCLSKWWLWTPMQMVVLKACENGGSKHICKW